MATHDELRRAYTLIKQEQIDEALSILRPIVQAEPENVDAWWLLANAAVEPDEAREALLMVLRTDPDYANAPKAREMLGKLNEQFPPTPEEIERFPELRPAAAPEAPEVSTEEEWFGLELEEPFGEPAAGAGAPPFMEDAFDDPFGAETFEAIDIDEEVFNIDEDPFAVLDEDPFALDEPPAPAVEVERREPVRTVIFDETPEALDPEARAAGEERAARRRGRAGRVLGALAGLVLVAVLVIALIALLLPALEPKATDLGSLSAISADDQQAALVQAVSGQVQVAALPAGTGAPQVVLANSALGPTLFVQLCARPTPALPQIIEQAMTLAVSQASALAGQDTIRAVGVNITRCDALTADTLYRAAVPLADAAAYADLQPGDPRWMEFQSRWN